jgi:hypothetical protein
MRAIRFENDIITAVGTGPVPGVVMPIDVPKERLRYDSDNDEMVDIASVQSFYIDALGQKHIKQAEGTWQPLQCAWDAELVFEADAWRVRDIDDRLRDAQARGRAVLAQRAEQARQRYITGGDGKAAVYSIKRDEAKRWQAAVAAGQKPSADACPWMAARAARLKTSLQVVADEWNGKAAAWEAIGRDIENAYEAAVEAVQALTSGETADADVVSIVEAVRWP